MTKYQKLVLLSLSQLLLGISHLLLKTNKKLANNCLKSAEKIEKELS
jgi:hypothetical protein